jgi:hypothetical protein
LYFSFNNSILLLGELFKLLLPFVAWYKDPWSKVDQSLWNRDLELDSVAEHGFVLSHLESGLSISLVVVFYFSGCRGIFIIQYLERSLVSLNPGIMWSLLNFSYPISISFFWIPILCFSFLLRNSLLGSCGMCGSELPPLFQMWPHDHYLSHDLHWEACDLIWTAKNTKSEKYWLIKLKKTDPLHKLIIRTLLHMKLHSSLYFSYVNQIISKGSVPWDWRS